MPELPKWATLRETPEGRVTAVDVDADGAYTAWLKELRVKETDQYWLEVCYQCMKMELQIAMGAFAFEIRIHDPEKKWSQKKYKKGKGAEAASKGLEAREHFKRVRHILPA